MRDQEWDDLTAGGDLEETFDRLQRRDWELWSIALVLLTIFAGGVIVYFYSQSSGGAGSVSAPVPLGYFWQVLLGLLALVVLLNTYLIDRKKSLARLWRRYLLQSQELEHLRETGTLDPLTQVYSRRHFDEAVQQEALRCERAGHPLSFLLLDLVGFGEINQRQGHFVGDQILQGVARVLQASLRRFDLVFRYAGDDFMMILSGAFAEDVVCVQERLRKQLAADKELRKKTGQSLVLAFGCATYTKGKKLDEVVEEAERNLSAVSPTA